MRRQAASGHGRTGGPRRARICVVTPANWIERAFLIPFCSLEELRLELGEEHSLCLVMGCDALLETRQLASLGGTA